MERVWAGLVAFRISGGTRLGHSELTASSQNGPIDARSASFFDGILEAIRGEHSPKPPEPDPSGWTYFEEPSVQLFAFDSF